LTLTRESLATAEVELLSRGGPRNPDVLCVRLAGDVWVVKDFSGRGRLAGWLAPWLISREVRAYRQLEGHPAVPRLRGRIDRAAFALEYRPGEIMGPHLAGHVPDSFIAELRAAVSEMHARGVVHLDLRHRSNALADPAGRPVLIDFASALCFRPNGLAARFVLPLLAWIDLRAVDKWARQLAANTDDTGSVGPAGAPRRS
jgi:hypothetical protein